MLLDSEQRIQASNPFQSFIVQAPAGSGKTEILTQRFLRLLAIVNAPEQIIALTFTRKAAQEMRERIITALNDTAEGKKAQSAHQQQTMAYAAKALQRSQQLDWQLLDQPSRLKIMTIDALCQSLTQAIPLSENHISFASIAETPKRHYEEAARGCIRYALETREYQKSLKIILLHLDNRQDILIKLLSDLLAQRDQWLGPLYQGKDQEKALYEKALALIEQHELEMFRLSLPAELADELTPLARKAADLEANPQSPRHILRHWTNFSQISAEQAKALCALLLKTDDNIRQSFDHHLGIKKENCTPHDYQQIKQESKTLLAQLAEQSSFLNLLLAIRDLPPPYYEAEQWEVLTALFSLLPMLVVHLQLIFAEHNTIDFPAVSQQALSALGEEDQPTDLALYLDHVIHHLLVDEFQDTSITQFQLLSQLVRGWQPEDAKTLFVVGDPMQSIYRFRQAEVGLFLKAQKYGLGPVRLTPLELRCNFRSRAKLIDWVNEQFPHIFPDFFDVESGAVSFLPSASINQEDGSITAWQFPNRQEEAEAITNLVTEQLSLYPEQNIAILVRSRSQLPAIIEALRAKQIPYQGMEIDLLAGLQHIKDLWSLTKALLMPANRLAWLELLRSPYGGFGLKDLFLLANIDCKKSIYHNLSQKEKLSCLSQEGQIRADYVYAVMHQAIRKRFQESLSQRVMQTWQNLQGNTIISTAQQDDLEQYWQLLDRFEQDGLIADLESFKAELKNLYSKQVVPSNLQIMTIHKSKGLEFDCVILPSLSSSPKAPDKPLLRWLKLPTANEEILLLSPIKAAHQEKCPLYYYLSRLDAKKSSYELQRLLYVAVTRAKKSLYLFDNKSKAGQGSFRNLLQRQDFVEHSTEASLINTAEQPVLMKLPLQYYAKPFLDFNENFNPLPSLLSQDTSRITGVIAHQLLQQICEKRLDNSQALPWSFVHYELQRMGLSEEQKGKILQELELWFKNLFSCPIGQWIIQAHVEEKNEYELLISKENQIITRIIDRLFIENNLLWIIDFKTGADTIQAKEKHYRQVLEYAQIMALKTTLPIRCGLYYLANNHWEYWNYNPLSEPKIKPQRLRSEV